MEIGIQSNDGECTQATTAELEVKVRDERERFFHRQFFQIVSVFEIEKLTLLC